MNNINLILAIIYYQNTPLISSLFCISAPNRADSHALMGTRRTMHDAPLIKYNRHDLNDEMEGDILYELDRLRNYNER
jgi:hypothetical protein